MAVSARQRYLAVVWSALTIVLTVTEADAQPYSDYHDAPG